MKHSKVCSNTTRTPVPVSTTRNAEATVVMERAALLGTSIKHTQPSLDLAQLWGNLAAAQQGEARGLNDQHELEDGCEEQHVRLSWFMHHTMKEARPILNTIRDRVSSRRQQKVVEEHLLFRWPLYPTVQCEVVSKSRLGVVLSPDARRQSGN